MLNSTCATSLAPGESCSFEVTFAPYDLVSSEAVIDITDGKLATRVELYGSGYILH